MKELVDFKIVDFVLEKEQVSNVCMFKADGKKCYFLDTYGDEHECVKFTKNGVKIHRRIRNRELKLQSYGCNHVIDKILEKEDFFVGKIVEYSDGANIEEKRVIHSIRHNKKELYIMLIGKKDILPFPFYSLKGYLSISLFENIIRFTNELGGEHSIDILF